MRAKNHGIERFRILYRDFFDAFELYYLELIDKNHKQYLKIIFGHVKHELVTSRLTVDRDECTLFFWSTLFPIFL